jgi:gelsolin
MYAHVWTGKQSTKDEISYVNFKVLQLDKKLENNLVIYYESQGKESEVFKSYFDFFTVVKGGVDSDLEQYKSENYRAKLFHVHSKGSKIQSREISINRKNLDSGDVYLLDIGLKVFIWTGKKSNSYEKFHIGCLAQKIKDIRHNKVTVVTLYEDEQDEKERKEFDDYLDKYEESDFETQQSFNSSFKKMMKLSDENGKLELTEVPYDRNSLKSEDSFLVDRGDAIIIWVGSKASQKEKRFARIFANKYISTESRNASMPVYITNEAKAGKELEKCFS